MIWYRFALGLVLTGVAGAIDAVSFLRLGAVYASFMSGNTVQIGLHGAAADWLAFGYFLALVGIFMLGGFVGSMVVMTSARWHLPLVLLLEGTAVALSLWLDLRQAGTLASTAPLSLAMGAQNSLVVLVRGANPATTFVTGTAYRFADALAQRVLGRDPFGAWKLHGLVWLAFAAGAALGTVAQLRLRDYALAPVAATIGTVALAALLAALVRGWRRRAGGSEPSSSP